MGKWNRVKEFELTMSGGKRYVVKVPTDPAKHPERPVVVKFPVPVHTQCISVIIRNVYKAKKTKGELTYIGEVTAYTTLDSGKGIEEFLEWFEDPKRAARATELMKDFNPDALTSIVDTWANLGPAAQRCVISTIHEDWIPALPSLVEAAVMSIFADEDGESFSLLVDSTTCL